MDYSQRNSVFMPGLSRQGPVYNSNYMSGLPALTSGMKLALVAGLLAAGMFKKIPLMYAGLGAFAVWSFFPDDTSAATLATPAAVAPIVLPAPVISTPVLDLSQIPMPTFPSVMAQ